jgi:hypothetical protein
MPRSEHTTIYVHLDGWNRKTIATQLELGKLDRKKKLAAAIWALEGLLTTRTVLCKNWSDRDGTMNSDLVGCLPTVDHHSALHTEIFDRMHVYDLA